MGGVGGHRRLVSGAGARAGARRIPLQIGTTNGGNDGSAFSDWGVPDVPIGWPLRYSHSPAEVVEIVVKSQSSLGEMDAVSDLLR